jgi:hypothetical protein
MHARRRAPVVGAPVTVSFLAARVRGTVEEVLDEGRRVMVLTDEGELIEFALSPVTGIFVRDGNQTGARLSFDD